VAETKEEKDETDERGEDAMERRGRGRRTEEEEEEEERIGNQQDGRLSREDEEDKDKDKDKDSVMGNESNEEKKRGGSERNRGGETGWETDGDNSFEWWW